MYITVCQVCGKACSLSLELSGPIPGHPELRYSYLSSVELSELHDGLNSVLREEMTGLKVNGPAAVAV